MLDQLEVFGRYDVTLADAARGASQPFHSLKAGASWYFAPHSDAAKLTFDAQEFLTPTNQNPLVEELLDDNDVGLLPYDKVGQTFLEVQFQAIL